MMSDSVLEIIKLVVTGAFGGALGGALVTWANWGIEKRRQKLNYQHELIKAWRKMISSAQATYRKLQSTDQEVTFAKLIEGSPDFFSLKPHLSQKALDAVKQEKHDDAVVVLDMGRKTVVNPPDAIVETLIDEVARIEAEWDLV